jgi:hypothetical protein
MSHFLTTKSAAVLRLSGAIVTCAALARADMAWSNDAAVGVRVNGHAFHDVHAEGGGDGSGCQLRVRLLFEAPESGYSDPKNKTRNHHYFRARVKFAKGQTAESKTFGNSGPGERTYSFEEDTTAAGCWAKDPNKIVKLDVIGCRGPACDLGTFED